MKTFAALGVHGTSAITCLTAQNPKQVIGIQAATAEFVHQQIEAVFAELKPRAVKTGMLFSEEIIQTVANFFSAKRTPLIVDPVMVSTSGSRLLKESAIKTLREKLFPLASLVTPNLDEARLMLNEKLSSVEDLRRAARTIHEQFGCAALLKGGHLRGLREAVDIFYDGKTELLLSAPFIKGVSTHGTGCTYSAAIAGFLALGHDLPMAVQKAKEFISHAIANSVRVGRHFALRNF